MQIFNLNKKQCFIIGTIFLFIAIMSITFLPLIVKHFYKPISNNYYRFIELIMLTISTAYYIFSYKYYKYQVIAVLYGILFYYAFVQFYWFLN